MTSLGLLSFIKIDMKVDERHRNPEIKRSNAKKPWKWARNYNDFPSTSELVDFQRSRSSGCERGGGAQSKDPNKSRSSWAADMTWHRFAAANAPCCQWPHQVRSRARSSLQAVWGSLDACSLLQAGPRGAACPAWSHQRAVHLPEATARYEVSLYV